MSVLEAVESDLASLGDLAGSGLAASALEIARGLDGPASLAMKSMAAKELRDTMAILEAKAPPVERKDDVDQLRSRREAKIRAAAS